MPDPSRDSLLRRETHATFAMIKAELSVLMINCERLKDAPGFDCEEFKSLIEAARVIVDAGAEASRTRKNWNSRANPSGQ